MSDLLIHSMAEFSELILFCLDRAEARSVVEVGAEYGGMSQILADHVSRLDGQLTSIDPSPRPEFLAWAEAQPAVRHIARPSLDAMPGLTGVDAWLIDGDHNYYTVLHELKIADSLSRRDGRPLLAFLHDVSWPTARRDMYYAPERIPADWRHDHDFRGGVTLDHPHLIPDRGFRGMGQFAFARQMGGPRNGVLTAVEDFLAAARSEERRLGWAFVPAVFGLGVVFDADAPWAGEVAAHLLPYHDNPLLAALEANRLRNYLAVIDAQDRAQRAA